MTELETRYGVLVEALKLAFGRRLKAVALFGSQARGTARPDSDHDIFVIVEDLPSDPIRRQRVVRMPLLPVLDRLPGAVAFIAKTPEEVDANLTPLLLDICCEGVWLWGQEYFEPYRQKALRALRESRMRRERLGGTWMWVLPDGPSADWELTWEGYRERAG